MKPLTILAAILTAIWLPVAFMQAMHLQAQIDLRNARAERLAKLSP